MFLIVLHCMDGNGISMFRRNVGIWENWVNEHATKKAMVEIGNSVYCLFVMCLWDNKKINSKNFKRAFLDNGKSTNSKQCKKY